MSRASQQQREAIEHEAALWVVRSAGMATAEAPPELKAWLAKSPEHELAYARHLRAWRQAGDVLAVGDAGARRTPRRWDRPQPAPLHVGLRRAAGWASVSVLGAAAVVGLWVSNSGTAYATAVGEHRVVQLSDGSRIEMNTATRIVVRYTLTGRNVDLKKGEALFEVAPNKRRPFNVIANDERVRAVGTAFNVRVNREGIEVLVSKGVVEVDPQRPGAGREHRLTAGMMASLRRDGDVIKALDSSAIERGLAWRHGAIALNGLSLKQAVAEFNRYNIRQMRVADPTIADLKLGGYFRANDLDDFAQALKTTFGVEVSKRDDQTLYLSRARQ